MSEMSELPAAIRRSSALATTLGTHDYKSGPFSVPQLLTTDSVLTSHNGRNAVERGEGPDR
jgi:hypothetical protein